MDNQATIKILVRGLLRLSIRKQSIFGWANLSQFNVFIDERERHGICQAEETFAVAPGKHNVTVKQLWMCSDTVEVDLSPDQSVELEYGIPQRWNKIVWIMFLFGLSPLGLWLLVMYHSEPNHNVGDSMRALVLLAISIFGPIFIFGSWSTYMSFRPGYFYYLKKLSTR